MTPIDPPPGLLDKVAEALIGEGGGPGDSLHSWRCEYPDIYGPCDCVAETVRELWDAVAEGLGLSEEMAEGCHVCAGLVPCDRYDEHRRRLVSDPLEPQP
jgi:hypothetical protein